LQNQTASETVRIGLETNWGGTVVEVSLNGTNYVNQHDTGREIQTAFWQDGNSADQWNPNQGGDQYNNGTPTLAQTLATNSLYTKSLILLWNPDPFGGGPTHPIPSDIQVEQTVTPVPSSNRAFHLHYKVIHLGTDLHTNAEQQIPVMYTNSGVDQFVYYGGTAPWTNDAVIHTQFTTSQSPFLYSSEQWGALLDASGNGLTLYVPSHYPWVFGGYFPFGGTGPMGNAMNSMSPFVALTLTPNLVFESDAYVIAGDYHTARKVVYDLHKSSPAPYIFAPYGRDDLATGGSIISGIATVSGWAFAATNVASVQLLVDGTVDGTALYGSSRPDILNTFPNISLNTGFSYALNTAKYNNGVHALNTQVIDTSGNVAIFATRAVTISN
jgi:hypothetical protein